MQRSPVAGQSASLSQAQKLTPSMHFPPSHVDFAAQAEPRQPAPSGREIRLQAPVVGSQRARVQLPNASSPQSTAEPTIRPQRYGSLLVSHVGVPKQRSPAGQSSSARQSQMFGPAAQTPPVQRSRIVQGSWSSQRAPSTRQAPPSIAPPSTTTSCPVAAVCWSKASMGSASSPQPRHAMHQAATRAWPTALYRNIDSLLSAA